jgi:parallel beta-helix repeat protein
MKRVSIRSTTAAIGAGLTLVAVALTTPPAAGSQDDWNCRLSAYYGALGGVPQDANAWMGVDPGATDDYDPLLDARKPGEPMGQYVYTWFDRLAWGKGRITSDRRPPIPEGTSKRWGTALSDTWNVKTNIDNGPSGYFHPDCDPLHEFEYPVAASIYIAWEFGVREWPPYPLPPEDYTFSLIYRGGINPKPAGTMLPDAMQPPALDFSWDMEATPHIVLPLWSIDFHPWRADCGGFQVQDTAKFFILVHNPSDTALTCEIAVEPGYRQVAPATFTFTGTACCGGPVNFSWDFGDGTTGTGNPISHTYDIAGNYTVACTVSDDDGGQGTCQTSVAVARAEPIHVDRNSDCPDPDGSQGCPYQRIQDAIDVAFDGDAVLVWPGVYQERVDFSGKAITVTSVDPLNASTVAATVIDGRRGVAVNFVEGEVADSVLQGFTIRNSDPGVSCSSSSPTIVNNVLTGNGDGICCHSSSPIITGNTIVGNDCGIWCLHSASPKITRNIIAGNHTTGSGGGIVCHDSSPRIANNTITGNSADLYGGGIYCYWSSPTIVNCTIADNMAGVSGDAICVYPYSSATVRNTIIWNHDCPGCGLIALYDTSSITISYSVACTDTGEPWPGPGNICADPQFVDAANGDYHLAATSPCLGAGDPEDAPGEDVDGDPRSGRIDIGADQWTESPFRFNLRGGCWHLITIPCDPLDPDPWELFDELRPPNKPTDLLSGCLYRYDDATGGYVMYRRDEPEEFGTITPGAGYWLWLYDDESIAYEVECSSEPQLVHFATAGWHLAGHPRPGHSYVDDTYWHDSANGPHPFSVVTQPGDLLWLQDPLYCWSPSDGGYLACGLREEEDDHLRAFKGYWLYTFVDEVTMEAPAG